MDIQKKLFSLQDQLYGDFHSALMPTIERNRVIGVRMPQLRTLAKELRGSAEAEIFLSSLPHTYYEENNLHALLLEEIRNYRELLEKLERFLPYVDNWATCDSMSMKLMASQKKETLGHIRYWLESKHCYTVRFAIGLLMRYYLEEDFRAEYMYWVAEKCGEEYYVNMMIAWYFATALYHQYDTATDFLRENKLPLWVHNKAIQKATESHRITAPQKAYLRTLRRR